MLHPGELLVSWGLLCQRLQLGQQGPRLLIRGGSSESEADVMEHASFRAEACASQAKPSSPEFLHLDGSGTEQCQKTTRYRR